MLLPTYLVLGNNTTHIFQIYIYRTGGNSLSCFKSALGASWILKVIYHMSAHCSVHT